MEEPINCPWCGEKPKMYSTKYGAYWLECENLSCPVQPMSQAFRYKETLIKKWNRRETP